MYAWEDTTTIQEETRRIDRGLVRTIGSLSQKRVSPWSSSRDRTMVSRLVFPVSLATIQTFSLLLSFTIISELMPRIPPLPSLPISPFTHLFFSQIRFRMVAPYNFRISFL